LRMSWCCLILWWVRYSFNLKFLLQKTQFHGLSCECEASCRSLEHFCTNRLSQKEHSKGKTLLWTLMCLVKDQWESKSAEQMSQTKTCSSLSCLGLFLCSFM
jgi:hypothetical protein